MKTATSTLRTEHEAIISMLSATEEAARRKLVPRVQQFVHP